MERSYDLSDLSAAGAEIAIEATPDQRAQIAQWLGIVSVEKFTGVVTLKKLAMNRYSYLATMDCNLTQASVVSLEPVQAHVREQFSRELHVAYRGRQAPSGEADLTLAAADDEAPEEIGSPHYDLAGPLLEELSLALDPYPRAPGEHFSAPSDGTSKRESPFAALKKLTGEG